MLVVFAEVSKMISAPIPNGADPMMEWFFIFSSSARLLE